MWGAGKEITSRKILTSFSTAGFTCSLVYIGIRMGHERVGLLPRSKKWGAIADKIGSYHSEDEKPQEILRDTLASVRGRLKNIEEDPGFLNSLKFLIILSRAGSSRNLNEYFKSNGIDVEPDINQYSLVASFSKWLENKRGDAEYSEIAKQATASTIASWWKKESTAGIQTSIFENGNEVHSKFSNLNNGASFSDIARSYFSNFLFRYTCYFLDRVASSKIENYEKRNRFSETIKQNIEDLSRHAFESTKITQSFSAGWYNKNCVENLPTNPQIFGFIKKASGKLQEELFREGVS